MRGGTRRAYALVPGRPCMVCNGQLRVSELSLDRAGLLDDPEYISQSGINTGAGGPNVAALAASVSVGLLAQFAIKSGAYCPYENATAHGDARQVLADDKRALRERT